MKISFTKNLFIPIFLFVCGTSAFAERIYLSVDGGGMFGMIPTLVLQDIEKETGRSVHELFAGVMGTSTGALIAAAAVIPSEKTGRPATTGEIIEFYEKHGGPIFSSAFLATLFGGDPAKVFKKELKNHFGDHRVSDALIPLAIVTYDVRNRETYIFNSTKAKLSPKHDTAVRHATLASASIEELFGSTDVTFNDGKTRQYIDAGKMGYNDPTPLLEEKLLATGGEDVWILSLSTGILPTAKFTDVSPTGKKVIVVRLEPDMSELFPAESDSESSRYLAAGSGDAASLAKLRKVAAQLIKTPEYREVLLKLKAKAASLAHDEL